MIGEPVAICRSGRFGRLSDCAGALPDDAACVVPVFGWDVSTGLSEPAVDEFCVGEGSNVLRSTTASMTCGRNSSGGSPLTDAVFARSSSTLAGIGLPSVSPELLAALIWPGVISIDSRTHGLGQCGVLCYPSKSVNDSIKVL